MLDVFIALCYVMQLILLQPVFHCHSMLKSIDREINFLDTLVLFVSFQLNLSGLRVLINSSVFLDFQRIFVDFLELREF